MKPSVKRAMSLLLSAALLVSALAIYALLIRGQYGTIQELQGRLEAKTEILNIETTAVEQVKNLKAALKNEVSVLSALSYALPQEEAVSSVVAQINSLSQLHGVVLQGVGISYLPMIPPPVKLSFAKGMGALRMDIKFVGPYASSRDFLGDLERNLRIMDVKNLKMESASKTGQDLMSFSLTVDTYYQVK